MGNIPLTSVLGISMSIFATLISVVAMKTLPSLPAANEDVAGPVFIIAIAFLVGAFGIAVHGANLDFDPAVRSFAYAFIGANMTIGWSIWAGEGDWLDFVPNIAIVIVGGLILGLLMSDGDVQKETRERWRREAQSKQNADPKTDEKKASK